MAPQSTPTTHLSRKSHIAMQFKQFVILATTLSPMVGLLAAAAPVNGEFLFLAI